VRKSRGIARKRACGWGWEKKQERGGACSQKLNFFGLRLGEDIYNLRGQREKFCKGAEAKIRCRGKKTSVSRGGKKVIAILSVSSF